jgi:3-oxoacyl-[acyl-carrier protein] reductase
MTVGGRPAALVTGSARGIGRGIALGLAAGGYDVAVHYRSSAEAAEATRREAESLGVRAVALQADLAGAEPATRLVEEAHATFGRLDVLVNNVGNYVFKPFSELELAEWRDVLDTNLEATFGACRAALPLMKAQGSGRIVNLGFAGAQNLVGRPSLVAYAIAKTGVAILTKAIAKEAAPFGVTANVVAPGVIENSVEKPVSNIPAGIVGRIDDVVNAVLFFCSPGAGYVTGQVLEVAGGWNL